MPRNDARGSSRSRLAQLRLAAGTAAAGAREPIGASNPAVKGVQTTAQPLTQAAAGTKVMDGSFQTNAGGTQRVVFEYDTPWSQDSSGVLSVYWQKQAGPSGDPLHVVWKADRHTLPGLGRPQPGPGRATDTGWRAHRLRERGTRRAAQPELLSRQGLLGPGRRSFGCARAGLARPCCDAQSMCS